MIINVDLINTKSFRIVKEIVQGTSVEEIVITDDAGFMYP